MKCVALCVLIAAAVLLPGMPAAGIDAGPTGWWTDYNGNNYYGNAPGGGGGMGGMGGMEDMMGTFGGMLLNTMLNEMFKAGDQNTGQTQQQQQQRLEAERQRLEQLRKAQIDRASRLRDQWDRQDQDVVDQLKGVFDTLDPNAIDPFGQTFDGRAGPAQGLAGQAEQWADQLKQDPRGDLADRDADFRSFRDKIDQIHRDAGLPEVPEITDGGGPVGPPQTVQDPGPNTVRLSGDSPKVNDDWMRQMQKRARETMAHHQQLMSKGPLHIQQEPHRSLFQRGADKAMDLVARHAPPLVNEQVQKLRSTVLDANPRLREMKKILDYGEGMHKRAPNFLTQMLGDDVAPALVFGDSGELDAIRRRINVAEEDMNEFIIGESPVDKDMWNRLMEAQKDGQLTQDELNTIIKSKVENEIYKQTKSSMIKAFKQSVIRSSA